MRAMLILGSLSVIFTVFTTVFAASAPAKEVRNLPKWLWVLLCLFTTPVGGALYLIFGRPGSTAGRASRQPLAPDDDPDFLRELKRRLAEDGDQ